MNKKFMIEYDREKVNKKLMNSLRNEGKLEGISQGIEQGISQGIEQGISQGIEQGIEQEKIQIARNSLKQKLNINTISAITGLSINQINNLKSSI